MVQAPPAPNHARQAPEPGARVQLHPATDWWMRGARYGTVQFLLPGGDVVVRLDYGRITQRFRAEDVTLA